MNRLFSRSRSGRTTAAQDGSQHDDQHDGKKRKTTVPLAFAATYDDDDDIADHDDQLAHHHRHHVSSRTGGFEMSSYDEGEEHNIAAADDDTLQDSSIYTDPCKIAGPRSTDGSNVILHDSDSAGVCSTATTVQRQNEKSVRSLPLYTGYIDKSIEVYKRALRIGSSTPPRPSSTIATTRVRTEGTNTAPPMPGATPSVIEVRRNNRIPLTPVASSSSNIFWKQQTTPTTPDTATTTATTTPSPPSNNNNSSSNTTNNTSDQSSTLWKSPVPGDKLEQEQNSSLRKSWSLMGGRRWARTEKTTSTRSGSTSASTATVGSSPEGTDPQANTHAVDSAPVPCNLSSYFKLAMQTETPMSDNEVIVGVSRSGQGREVEESSHSHSHEQATITSLSATTASSSSPLVGEYLDEDFEVMDFATTPTATRTKTTCSPVPEEDDCDEDDYISSSSSSSAHSSSSDDLQVNKINVSDIELMRDAQNPGALRLTADGLQSHERQSFQKAVHLQGRGDTSSGNNTYEQWKRAKLQQKWHRDRHNERQDKLMDQHIRIRQSLEQQQQKQQQQQQQQQQQHRKNTTDSKRKQARADHNDKWTKKNMAASKSEVEEVSLAPLNMMEDLDLKIDADEVSSTSTRSRRFGIFGMFRSKSSDVSVIARDLLQKEREAAAEAHTQRKFREHRDRQRIELNRQAYLEEARMKESNMTPIPMRVFSEPLPGLLGDGDWF
jgi:hypothetical protein